MHCTKCGSDNIEGALTCANCGAPLAKADTRQGDAQQANTRKTVQMPSYKPAEEIARSREPVENDRPWEVRVPTRAKQAERTSRTTRRTASQAAKKPAKPNTKKVSQTVSAAQAAGTTNAASAVKVADASKRQTPTPRRISKNQNSGGKRAAGIIVALALVGCIGAGAWYFTHGNVDMNVVSFDTNGGSTMSQRNIVENGQLQQPTPPTRDGYTFEGWYQDAAYTEPVQFPLTITEDITLYAKWSPAQGGASTSASTSSSSSSSAATNVSGGGVPSNTTYGGGNSSTDGSGYSGGGSAGGGSGSGGGSAGGGSGSGGSGSESGSTSTDITVIATDGTPLSGTVRLTDGYVIGDSSEHAYTIDELRALNLSDAELCIAWNEPFARLGNDFDNPGLQGYFDNRSWYSNSFRKVSLEPGSPAEVTVANLQALARENPSSAAWLDLRTY